MGGMLLLLLLRRKQTGAGQAGAWVGNRVFPVFSGFFQVMRGERSAAQGGQRWAG